MVLIKFQVSFSFMLLNGSQLQKQEMTFCFFLPWEQIWYCLAKFKNLFSWINYKGLSDLEIEMLPVKEVEFSQRFLW